MKNFRTYQLALALYRRIEKLPLSGELKDQIARASMSVVLNLAEGSGETGKNRIRFFRMALASLRETQACLDITNDPKMKEAADQVGGSIYRLMQNPGQCPGA